MTTHLNNEDLESVRRIKDSACMLMRNDEYARAIYVLEKLSALIPKDEESFILISRAYSH